MKFDRPEIEAFLSNFNKLPEGAEWIKKDGTILWAIPPGARRRKQDGWIAYLTKSLWVDGELKNFVYHVVLDRGIQPWELDRFLATSVSLFEKHIQEWLRVNKKESK